MPLEIAYGSSSDITAAERSHAVNIEQNIRNYAAKNRLVLDDFWIGGSERVRSLAIDKLRSEGWRIDEDRTGQRPLYTITPPGNPLESLKGPQ